MGKRFEDSAAVAAVACEAATFSWNLGNNVVLADANMARFFELPLAAVEDGLPIECFIEKAHPEDRAKLAKSIHDAIISGEASQESYRLLHADGSVIHVMTFGQCFRDKDGVPSIYSGMVFVLASLRDDEQDETLLHLCQTAYDCARHTNNDAVRSLLEMAVLQLTQSGPLRPASTSRDTKH